MRKAVASGRNNYRGNHCRKTCKQGDPSVALFLLVGLLEIVCQGEPETALVHVVFEVVGRVDVGFVVDAEDPVGGRQGELFGDVVTDEGLPEPGEVRASRSDVAPERGGPPGRARSG